MPGEHGHWDVRLLTASYSAAGDGVIVELYGKTRENRSITIRYHGFKPYFYLVEPSDNRVRQVKASPHPRMHP